MNRPNPVVLALFLAAVLGLVGGLVALKGGLYLSKHEGDTLHLLDIVFRIAAGERIHQDFMTPIGVLAFAPIVWFLRLGYGAGHAMIYAQILVAALALPVVWWVVRSRLAGFVAWLTGFYLMVLALALTYGEADASLSMSMHYNRWSWILAYVAILLAMLPNLGRPRPVQDGVLIGLALAALALLKITYFVAFAPPVAVLLILRRDWAGLGAALVAGLAVAALATLWGGTGFWIAYAGDLREVAASPNRPQPGAEPGTLLGAPAFLGVNLVLLFSVIHLRHARRSIEGVALLILAPGFVYVTYQNFGNDPQWLLLLVAILLMLRPGPEVKSGFGWNLRQAFNVTAAAALAFAAPSFLNLAYSAYRHAGLDTAKYTPLLPRNPVHADLLATILRADTVNAVIGLDGADGPYAKYRPLAERKTIATVNGEELPDCEIQSGLGAWYETLAADLAAAGYAGRAIFEADLINVLYLFGDFPPLKGAAPWYYGGTPGIADAEFVLVTDCPVSSHSRKLKLEALEAAGVTLTEVRRTGFYRLYAPTGSTGN